MTLVSHASQELLKSYIQHLPFMHAKEHDANSFSVTLADDVTVRFKKDAFERRLDDVRQQLRAASLATDVGSLCKLLNNLVLGDSK
jgi:hypothetical protein